MSPEVLSPYPDRPIRPLPKRRLRERLSPDVAESIRYPPGPKTATPLFYPSYNIREETSPTTFADFHHPSERERADELERNYIARRNGEEPDSDDEEAKQRSRAFSRHSADTAGRTYRYVQKPDTKHPNPQAPASTAFSADGYDSFENTNNKKKRKIPTPGDSNLNGAHLSSEMAGMGISGGDDLGEEVGVGSYHSPSPITSQGISGPGRGRYGRIRNGRSPLRTLSDASSNWGNGRTTKQRQPQWPTTTESPGIISRSIANANANAEKSPITPARGQENISLLQQAAKKSSPASTQFTFTCDSQVPGTVPWPGPSTANMHQSVSARKIMSTHATQTSPSMPSKPGTSISSPQSKQQQSQHPLKQYPQQPAPPKKNRRRTAEKEYLIAARERRQQTEYLRAHHPPNPEDIWICEFCEYERIFGTPPQALIRQYEIKDRRIRKQEADRRRLLEKAKMKGRKGKKGHKTAAKTVPNTQDRQVQHQPAPQAASMNQNQNQNQNQSQGTQSEDFYEDEYDDEYEADNPPPPSPVVPPVSRHAESAPLRPGDPPFAHYTPGSFSDRGVTV